jgi:uncharacterized SAM-binding protein YcdF (DUF218 family)
VNALDEIAKLLVPGTASCLAISLLIGSVLAFRCRRFARVGHAWLAGTIFLYAALSTSSVRRSLEAGLASGYAPLQHASEAPSVGAIVVIGNGVSTHLHGDHYVDEMKVETADNVAEGVRLFTLLDKPLVIVSGGIADPRSQARTEADMMSEALVSAGVPKDRIVMEAASRNTYEQARHVAGILRRSAIDHFVVVTAPTHMRRVDRLFRREGLTPIASVPLAVQTHADESAWPFTLASLRASRDASYEYVALVGYWLRGRI